MEVHLEEKEVFSKGELRSTCFVRRMSQRGRKEGMKGGSEKENKQTNRGTWGAAGF